MKRNIQTGLSLVELLIAMTIGLFLMAATGSVYLINKETYRASETSARLQENARAALHLIARDVQMAGFLGNSSKANLVYGRKGTTGALPSLLETSGIKDCADRWYVDTSSMLAIGNDGAPSVGGTSFADTCLAGKNLIDGTDSIALKHAASGEIELDVSGKLNTPTAHDTWTLIRTDPMRGDFYIGNSAGDVPAGYVAGVLTDRRWLAHVYFIEKDADEGVPLLRRLALGSGPNLYNRGDLVRGIQDLQVQLGVDTDGDGFPNSFVEPGSAGTNPVVAARIWVLARSETREVRHDDSINTYEYANKRYTPGDDNSDNETETTANPKQYRRLLLGTTVSLRNL